MSIRRCAIAPTATSLALIAALSGCSSADNQAACNQLRTTVRNISQQGLTQISDPAGLEKIYRDGAASVRSIAATADGDVQSAATAMADSLEKLGHGSGQSSPGSASAITTPDTAEVEKASDALEKACG